MSPQTLIDKAGELLDQADRMLDNEDRREKVPGTTEIVVIMDRSGSMTNIASDMQGGLEKFLRDQEGVNGKANVTIVQFDTEYEVLAKRQPIDMVTAPVLSPRGGTALLDAVGRTLCDLVREVPKEHLVVCMIITDGQENSSREFKRAAVRGLIEKCQSKRDWQFIFLGADPSAFAEAQSIGIPMAAAAVYDHNARGSEALFMAACSNVSHYRTSGKSDDLSWSDDQRVSMSAQ